MKRNMPAASHAVARISQPKTIQTTDSGMADHRGF